MVIELAKTPPPSSPSQGSTGIKPAKPTLDEGKDPAAPFDPNSANGATSPEHDRESALTEPKLSESNVGTPALNEPASTEPKFTDPLLFALHNALGHQPPPPPAMVNTGMPNHVPALATPAAEPKGTVWQQRLTQSELVKSSALNHAANGASQALSNSLSAHAAQSSAPMANPQVSTTLVDSSLTPVSPTTNVTSLLVPQISTQGAEARPTPASLVASSTTATSIMEWAPVKVDSSSAKWGEQMLQILGDRVTLQAQQQLQEARIRLDPPDLGKLDLLVRVDGDRLNVQINASTLATREALGQVSERLRAELQNEHFVHVDVNVGGETPQQGQRHTASDEGQSIFAARDVGEFSETMPLSSEHWLNLHA